MSAAIGATDRLWVHEELTGRTSARIRESTLVIESVSKTVEMGGEVHYVGTEERLDDLRSQLVLSGRGLPMKTHTLADLGRIARAARLALSENLDLNGAGLTVLGAMCLAPALVERIALHDRESPFLLVLDGVNGAQKDVQSALAGISAFCRDHGVTVAIFP